MSDSVPFRRLLLTLLVLATAAAAAWPHASRAQDAVAGTPPRVDVLHVEGPITPVVATYLERGLAQANRDEVDLVVIRLDTPGGSVQVTETLMREMAASDVPIAVWVGPSGAMAGSAGTFITLAAHVAAMAPGTTIGAASPIGGQGEELADTIKSKMENMLVANVRSAAERRGRDAQDWAESTVTQATASSAEEVLELRVIDAIARDLPELFQKIAPPFSVRVKDEPIVIDVVGAEIRDVEMTGIERFLHTITDPSVAYILMSLGMMGLMYEFANPGFGVGGVVGAICLLFGVYALGVLPANYAGVALMALAFAFFFADAKLGTSGLLALGGVVAMAAGGVLLFDSPIFAVSQPVLWATSISCGLFFAFVAGAVLRGQRRPVTTGSEGLIGASGVARSRLSPDGLVVVWGETWRATADDGPVDKGAAIEVTAVDGLHVRVRAVGPDTESTHDTATPDPATQDQ